MGMVLVTGAGDSSTETVTPSAQPEPATASLTPQGALCVCVFLDLGNAPVKTSSLRLKSRS